MKKTLNVTLAIEVDTTIEKVCDIVDNLTFKVSEDSENVSVVSSEVVDFFIV